MIQSPDPTLARSEHRSIATRANSGTLLLGPPVITTHPGRGCKSDAKHMWVDVTVRPLAPVPGIRKPTPWSSGLASGTIVLSYGFARPLGTSFRRPGRGEHRFPRRAHILLCQ